MSLSALADRTHYSKALLGHLETGNRTVRPEHVQAYEDALGVRINTRAVDHTDVELIRQAVEVVTAIGLRHGGIAAAEMTATQAEWARGLLDRASESVREPMSVQVARLVDRWAWSLADIGRTQRAASLYSSAIGIAPDEITRGAVMVNMANHYTVTGKPRAALSVLDAMAPVIPVVDFTAESARARAYATLGDWQATVRHVDLADDAHSRVDLSDLPDTHKPFATGHDAHADNEAGKAFALIDSPQARKRAVERLRKAYDRFGPDRARARQKCEQRLLSLDG
jgi:hypothetical protein